MKQNAQAQKKVRGPFLKFLSKSASYFHFCRAAVAVIFSSFLFALCVTHLTFGLYLCLSVFNRCFS